MIILVMFGERLSRYILYIGSVCLHILRLRISEDALSNILLDGTLFRI